MRKFFSTRKQLLQLLSCLVLLFSCIKSFAQQNLVPNPSFEQYTICPINIGTGSNSRGSCPDIWYRPGGGSNYWNKCTNNQPLDGVPYNFGGVE